MTRDVLERLRDAQNRHDLDSFVDCFDSAYRSEQPVHPDRAFTEREQVRRNWAAVFDGVPDFQAELLGSARPGRGTLPAGGDRRGISSLSASFAPRSLRVRPA